MAELADFDKLKISTKTIIAISNIKLSMEKLFYSIPITEYVVIPKKRGRKRRDEQENPNRGILPGSIISLKYKNVIRGVELKKARAKNYFRNALTIIMTLENKLINFKVSANGKFQITGCKDDASAENCLKYFWTYLEGKNAYTITDNRPFHVVFLVVMANVDFNLGFLVNKENLDRHLNFETEFNSLLETSFGYTGLNIKLPLGKDMVVDLRCIEKINSPDTRDSDDGLSFVQDLFESKIKEREWRDYSITYYEYLDMLSPKDKAKELKKERFITFLVFQSGAVICSSMNNRLPCVKRAFNSFVSIVQDQKEYIMERLE